MDKRIENLAKVLVHYSIGIKKGDLFKIKAEPVARPLVNAGTTPEELAALRLGQVPPSPDLDRLRMRRAQIGLPHGHDAPLLLHPDGEPVTAAQVPLHLRRARLTGVSIEANGGTCRDLLAQRYAATS